MTTELATNHAADNSTLAKELQELRQWLESARGVIEKLTTRVYAQQGQWSFEEMTPAQIILTLLKGKSEPIALMDLRQEIERHGMSQAFGHKFNYFYILIRRLERTGKIVWEGDAIRMKGGSM